jgi:iron complex outermembrane recepter protein
MIMKLTKKHILASTIGCLSLSQVAYAEIEEILVTAQKRTESAQEVPIAISTFSGERLENNGITSTDDLGFMTPGLSNQQGGIGNSPFIRGLGSGDVTPGQDQSVSTYVDGVLMPSVSGNEVMFNTVERVEVLKGPQGTLFGRNTTGGVINIITKDPSQDPTFNVRVGYGNYERASAGIYGSTGLTEDLAADLSVFVSDQGKGFGKNYFLDEDTNKREDEVQLRSKWKYTGDTLDVTAIASYGDYSDDLGYARGNPEDGALNLDGDPGIDDFKNTVGDASNWADFENKGLSLKIVKELSFMDVVSITAWNDNQVRSFTENDYSTVFWNNAFIDFDEETVTQEIQFLSNDEDSAFSWIGGLFFFDQEAQGRYQVEGASVGFPVVDFIVLNGSIDSTSYAAFGEVAYEFTEATKFTAGLRWTRDEREFSSNPGFEIGFPDSVDPVALGLPPGDPIPGWALLGLPPGTPSPLVTPLPNDKETWEEPTYRFVLDHQINDDIMVYASFNHGFRSGNYTTPVAATPDPIEPEIVDAYEVGFKSDWADGRVRLNGSAYFYDVDDLQLQILRGTSAITVNAAAAEIQGFDLDLTIAPTDEVTLFVGMAYTDGEYKNYDNAPSNVPCNVSVCTPGIPHGPDGTWGNNDVPLTIDASGDQIVKMPKWMISSGINWLKATDSGEWSATLMASYRDSYPFEPDGRLQQDSMTMLNASVGWRSVDGHLAVRINGNNLLDEFYSVHSFSTNTVGDFNAPGKPRTYGLTVEYDFF